MQYYLEQLPTGNYAIYKDMEDGYNHFHVLNVDEQEYERALDILEVLNHGHEHEDYDGSTIEERNIQPRKFPEGKNNRRAIAFFFIGRMVPIYALIAAILDALNEVQPFSFVLFWSLWFLYFSSIIASLIYFTNEIK